MKKSKTIKTERLILKPVSLSDCYDMFEYASDPENVKFVEFEPHQTIEDTKYNLKKYFLDNPEGKFGIYLNINSKLIGTIDARLKDRIVDLGWIINKKYWNKGFCTEAAKNLIDFYKKNFHVNIFTASFHEGNGASEKVMLKLGFKFKGKILTNYNGSKGESLQYILEVN